MSVDIVRLIESNPIARFNQTYQSKLIEKLQTNFSDYEQQLFLSNFYCYLKYDKVNDFIREFDNTNEYTTGFDRVYTRIFNWFFSIVKIANKENVALLMTELLDPLCETTSDIKGIKKFLKGNIRDFSDQYDCILVADISNEIDMEIGTELSKEKSIDIIMTRFKH